MTPLGKDLLDLESPSDRARLADPEHYFADHERELELSVSSDANKLCVVVEDSGPGFTDQGKLFSPFFTTKDSGMGMGLRICKAIIEGHEGTLRAEPRSPRGEVQFMSACCLRQSES